MINKIDKLGSIGLVLIAINFLMLPVGVILHYRLSVNIGTEAADQYLTSNTYIMHIALAPIYCALILFLILGILCVIKFIIDSKCLCYIPVTKEEIDALGLHTIEDYLLKIAEVTNKTEGGIWHKLFAYCGVSGIAVTDKQSIEISKIIQEVYHKRGTSKNGLGYLFNHLSFVKNMRQVENLVKVYLVEE